MRRHCISAISRHFLRGDNAGGVLAPFVTSPHLHHHRFTLCRSLRSLVESLFQIIVTAAPKHPNMLTALNDCGNLKKSEIIQISDGDLSVYMTTVNKALQNTKFRAAAWEAISFDPSVPFPKIRGDIMYGSLCALIHSPGLENVFLSDRTTSMSKVFYSAAAGLIDMEVMVYSESAALAGEIAERTLRNTSL